MLIIAQLTDFHVRPAGRAAYGNVDTNDMFKAAVVAILRLDPKPDCVVVTGDLTDCGLDEEYEIVREGLAALPMPVFVIPGNHDRRDAFVRALSSSHRYLPSNGFLSYVVEDYPLRLIALDSVETGETFGTFCAQRQHWLKEQLAKGQGAPTLIFIHHPPFLAGVDGMDELRLHDADAFSDIVSAHPEVERIICGHYHRMITTRFAGTIGFVLPSTAHQVALDLHPGRPNRFVMEPPALAVHTWQPETGVVSHLVPIGDYGPPFDIVLDQDYPGLVRNG